VRWAGARAIDLVGPGTARVKVKLMSAPANVSVTGGDLLYRSARSQDRANAERLARAALPWIISSTFRFRTRRVQRDGLFRVRVGSEPSEASAQKLGNKRAANRIAFISWCGLMMRLAVAAASGLRDAAMSDDCIFCKIGETKFPPNLFMMTPKYLRLTIFIHRRRCIYDLPRKHMVSLNDAEAGDAVMVGKMLLVAKQLAERTGNFGGYRIVINNGAEAGQSVDHLHVHVLGGRAMRWPPG